MTISRRALLSSTAIVPIAAALANCSFVQGVADTDIPKVVGDVSTIAGAVTTAENVVKSLKAVPASVRNALTGFVDGIRTKAQSVASVVSKVAAAPLVQAIEADVLGGLKAVTGIAGMPTSIANVFKDALMVLSAVKPLVGIIATIALAEPAGEVDAARLRLMAAAQGRLP